MAIIIKKPAVFNNKAIRCNSLSFVSLILGKVNKKTYPHVADINIESSNIIYTKLGRRLCVNKLANVKRRPTNNKIRNWIHKITFIMYYSQLLLGENRVSARLFP